MALISLSLVQVTKFSQIKIMDFCAFLCFSLKVNPFFSQHLIFFLFIVWFPGHFCVYLVTDKDYFIIATMKANFDSMYFIRLHIRVMF